MDEKYNFIVTRTNRVPQKTHIIHFVAQTKPWSNSNYLPKRNVWLGYAKKILTNQELAHIKNKTIKEKVKIFLSDCIVYTKNTLPKPLVNFLLNLKKVLSIKFY